MNKKFNKVMLFTLGICLTVVGVNTLAANEVEIMNVTLPKYKETYTSSTVYKNYDSKQRYHHVGALSDSGERTNIRVRIHNGVSGDYSAWITLEDDADHTFTTGFRNTGEYYCQLQNANFSVYKADTAGYWQYSME